VVVPGCAPGPQLVTIVPVTDTDWYITSVSVVSSACRTQPNGGHELTFIFDVLGDIPLPSQNVMVSLEEGKLFNILLEDGTLVAVAPVFCGYPEEPNDLTFDARVWTTPAGSSGGQCTFPAP
jgi:hypothetical protein